MEVIGLFYGHLVYFTAIWYILWPLGLCYYYLAHFSKFWIVFPRKIWQPCRRGRPRCHSCGFEAGILLCSGGVAQWTPHLPREQKARVRIPPGCKLLCNIDLITCYT
jgi:hypothetical protein